MARFNEWVALKGTLIFGSMWTAYLFFFYGFVPAMFPNAMNQMLYWSNTVQLWSLPLLMVGQNLQGRVSERRIAEMYDMLKEDLDIAREEREELQAVIEGQTALIKLLNNKVQKKLINVRLNKSRYRCRNIRKY